MAVKARDSNMSFIIGRETDTTGSPISDLDDMVNRQYVVTEWSHDENSAKQNSEALRAGRAGVFGEDGFLWGDGNFSVEVPSEQGFLDLIQGVLADPAPVSTLISDKVLVASGTNLSDILAANYFTDSSNSTVNIVNAQNLSPNGAKTLAETLEKYNGAQTLTVAPSSAADLTQTATPGTVTIAYTDSDGETRTITLSFPNASKTTAQTVALPAGATITAVTTTGWNAGTLTISTPIARNLLRNPPADEPGLLRFVFSATPDSSDGAQIIVQGDRRVGLASTDTLPLKEIRTLSGGDTTVLLRKNFHKIRKIEVRDSSGAAVTTGTVAVTSRPGRWYINPETQAGSYQALYKTTLKVVNAQFDGWTIEPQIDGEPWLVTKAVPIGATIDIGETIGVAIDLLSNRVDKRRTVEGGDVEQFVASVNTSAVKNDATKFPFVGRRFFSGYGRYLILDGEAVLCDAAPVTIAHNYDFSASTVPGRFRRGVEATDRRSITAAVQTRYRSGDAVEDTFTRWDEKFRNNEAVDARIATYQWLDSGAQLAIIYDLPYCEITEPVRVAVSSPGTIPVTVALKAVPSPGEIDAELKVTIIGYDNWS